MSRTPILFRDSTHSVASATVDVVRFFQESNVRCYIFAGLALCLHGLETHTRDSDIRILGDDLAELNATLRYSLPDGSVSLRGPRPYAKGMYLNDCIELQYGDVEIDICSDMAVECDLGTFTFPHGERIYDTIQHISYGNARLPVASLEFLLLYYLVLRRGTADGKRDEVRIQRILSSKKLDHDKFRAMIDSLPQAAQLRQLYESRLKLAQQATAKSPKNL